MDNNINQKVIAIQQQAGWNVGSAWYDKYVTEVAGSDASEEDMLRAFTDAFNQHFPVTLDGSREADAEAISLGAKPLA
jgi:hypothetical protein